MNYCTVIVAIAACIVSTAAKPSGLFPAPLVAAPVAYTAPIITSRSAQVFHRNFNGLLAAPVAYAAPAKLVGPAVAAPVVPTPAKLVGPAVAAPVVPAAAPFIASPFPYYI